jgi:hypothetical protein
MPKSSQYWIMEEKQLQPDFSLTKKLVKSAKKEFDEHR